MELRNDGLKSEVLLTGQDRQLFGTDAETVPVSQIGSLWRAARARLDDRRAMVAEMDMTPIVGIGWAALAGAVRPPAYHELQRLNLQSEQLALLGQAATSIEYETLGPHGVPLREL